METHIIRWKTHITIHPMGKPYRPMENPGNSM